jgi:hypothetical protein
MDQQLAAYERRFRRAGLPLLIEDHSPYEDVFTRAVPPLALVFLVEVLGAGQLDWPWWGNLLAVAGGLAVVLVAIALVNRHRGRPALAIPQRIGPPELAAFVIVPALLPIATGQVVSGLVTALGNLVLLALIYGVVGAGLLAIVAWAGRRLLGQLASSLELLGRALPLLLVFALVLFINTEMWQVFSSAPDAFLVLIGCMFFVIGVAFLAARLPREVQALEREVSPDAPLRPRERLNVGLVMFVSQGLQVAVVSSAVGLFFVAFGAFAIGPEVLESWIGGTGDEVLSVQVFGDDARVTVQLLEVSGALAAFSGLYYAIAVLTDSVYREEFLSDLEGSMRETFRARKEYLALRDRSAA